MTAENDYTLTDQEKALRDRLSAEDWMVVKAGFRHSYAAGRGDAINFLRRYPPTAEQQPGIAAALVWLDIQPASPPESDAVVTWTMPREEARDLLGWLRKNRPLGMPDSTFGGLVDALSPAATDPCTCDHPLADEFPQAPHSPLCPLWGEQSTRPAETQRDYVLDGSPEAVAIVREARGLPPITRPAGDQS